MKTTEVTIRKAVFADLDQVLGLVKELALYERAPEAVTADLSTYQNSFREGHFEALVTVLSDKIVGVALYYRRFSTWKGPYIYLEDFVVTESQRGKGIGAQLFEAFIEEARSSGAPLILWQVLDWNEPAINFYNKYDVEYDDSWLNVKMWLSTRHSDA